MVGPNCGTGLNGTNGPEMFNAVLESPDNSTDSDEEISVTNSELQLSFCTKLKNLYTHSSAGRINHSARVKGCKDISLFAFFFLK